MAEFTVKKKFDEIKKFLDLVGKRVDLSELQAELRSNLNIRTKKQVEICQKVFNKINGMIRDQGENKGALAGIRENIYNFLQMEEMPSEGEEDKSSGKEGNGEKRLSLSGFSALTSPTITKKKTFPFSEW